MIFQSIKKQDIEAKIPTLDAEVKEAIFALWMDKATSPNGFTAAIFKKNWRQNEEFKMLSFFPLVNS